MPKRSAESKIDYYTKKLEFLNRQEQEKARKRRRIIVYSSSSSSSDSEENEENGTPTGELSSKDIVSLPEPKEDTPVSNEQQESGIMDSASQDLPELDPDLLVALGDSTAEASIYGENIHHSLVERWLPILKKGLPKDTKQNLLKEYKIPDNCKLLKAPTLNPEISAAVLDVVRNRDKNILDQQDQLGLGLAAINKAITVLLSGDDKTQAIKILSDGCRILTDLHFVETSARTKLITQCLDKSFLPIVKDLDRDESLFGAKLPEKIKASKVIQRQGLQIKKPATTLRSTSSSSTPIGTSSTSRPRQQGNWMGPPRYTASNRGGRGGLSRPAASYRRASAPAQQTSQPRAPLNQNKPRAPALQ